MASINIDQISVVKEQNYEPGGDELYLTVNGYQVGPTSELSTGESYTFPYNELQFSGTANVHVYEDDGSGWNNDDHISQKIISDTPGSYVAAMDGDGGQYDVYYSIFA